MDFLFRNNSKICVTPNLNQSNSIGNKIISSKICNIISNKSTSIIENKKLYSSKSILLGNSINTNNIFNLKVSNNQISQKLYLKNDFALSNYISSTNSISNLLHLNNYSTKNNNSNNNDDENDKNEKDENIENSESTLISEADKKDGNNLNKENDKSNDDIKKSEKNEIKKDDNKDNEVKNNEFNDTSFVSEVKRLAQLLDLDPKLPNNPQEKIEVPKEYPQVMALPLTRRPLFPGFYKTLFVKDPKAINAINDLMARKQPFISVFMTKDETFDGDVVNDMSQIYDVGVFAQISNVYHSGPDNKGLTILLYPHRRIKIKNLIPPVKEESDNANETQNKEINKESENKNKDEKKETELPKEYLDKFEEVNIPIAKFGVSVVDVVNLEDEKYNPEDSIIKAVNAELLSVLKEISQINQLFREQIISFSIQNGGTFFAEAPQLADFAAAVSTGEPSELQSVLECLDIEERLQKALLVIKKELANVKLQQEISKEVDKKITRKQQEYFLMEQLRGIKKELGIDTDGKEKLIEKFKNRVSKLKMPEEVQKVFNEELNKLESIDSLSPEFNVTNNYLDWITQIPWGQRSEENFDLKHAEMVLNEDHYGLKEVKDRILEFIAVGKLKNSVEGKIICLVGPPGVGKTSVGKSIARALNRDFFRFSVGGLSDVAEIKGHRRTYVGAMPGKIIQALKKVQTENPLILIDEIDKLGKGTHGDLSSALLELLDPEQNNAFLDHYMDVPVDLSRVLFVCTANVLDTIPGPLLDRMEVISLSGYVAEEKTNIGLQYLSPQALAINGLEKKNVKLHKDAIELLIHSYARESGVRGLKKLIDKIYRKAALKLVKAEELATTKEEIEEAKNMNLDITAENLKNFVGPPIFTSERLYDKTQPGVVMGLAWTSMGGSSLYIESTLDKPLSYYNSENKKIYSTPQFNQTGQLGSVMKESSIIAYTFAKSFLLKRDPSNTFFQYASIHMHVPEGATPKDGPSAGCTITTALLSLAMNQSVKDNIAMTGEITLTGKILKIGGLREKTIAAKRSGVKYILFPEDNKNDWNKFPDYIKEGITGIPVGWYEEIFNFVFEKNVSNIKDVNNIKN
ncbi:ATP-dependent protease La [Piromyces finnis]|uniref:Lon protease homolog, mitochondrial n=1 Tax=Piromyces finnis TaxID=1754191 RepID=A0A1Y1VIK9_9FUNG|nr:ATP-dependent protease La [Piromyces finnis]|eukprot:ORX56477.1 ATP-dependent protease La [Piromyces finnis]